MAADDYKVGLAFFGNPLNLALRASENKMLMRLWHPQLETKLGKMDFGLFLNLILNR
jgi:hypothetical protein